MSRPKSEWHKSFKEKKELRKESKKDLKSLGQKFDDSLTGVSKQQKLRDKKKQRKEEERLAKAQQSSLFGSDKEARATKGKGGAVGQQARQNSARSEPVKDRKQMEKETRKFRGKRNSIGAKMAKFRGGIKANYKTGGIGDRDLTGKSKGM